MLSLLTEFEANLFDVMELSAIWSVSTCLTAILPPLKLVVTLSTLADIWLPSIDIPLFVSPVIVSDETKSKIFANIAYDHGKQHLNS